MNAHRSSWDERPLYWDRMVERVLNERRGWAKDHLYLGDHYFNRMPLTLPLPAFLSHVHCIGGSRDGKTTLAVQLAAQLLAQGEFSLVNLDLKGSSMPLNNLLQEADQVVRPSTNEPIYDIKIFTPQAGVHSHAFNPFTQSIWRKFTPLQQAEIFLDAFGIRTQEGSDSAFFAAMNELVTTLYLDRHRLIETVGRLLTLMNDRDIYKGMNGHANDWQHARHFVAMLARLVDCSAIARIPSNRQEGIDVSEIVTGDRPAFVYMYLPTLEDGRVSQTCARMFFKLLVRAASMARFDPRRRQVLVIVDEAQHLFGPSFVETLEQAREFGVSFLLFNQSRGQMVTASGDYRATLEACVGMQFMLSARNPEDINYVLSTSHEASAATVSWRQSRLPGMPLNEDTLHPDLAITDSFLGELGIGVGERPTTLPDRNQTLRVSADQQGGLVRCFRNEGLWAFNANWVPFRWHRHITPQEFRTFASTWPDPLPGMVLNSPPSLTQKEPSEVQGAKEETIKTVTTPTPPASLLNALNQIAEKFQQK